MKCQQCGYDHSGWLFEQGYEKRCVKCGNELPLGEEVDPLLDPALKRPGLLGRLFHGLPFKRKSDKGTKVHDAPAGEETGTLGESECFAPPLQGLRNLPNVSLESEEREPVFPVVRREGEGLDPPVVVKETREEGTDIRERSSAVAGLERSFVDSPDSIDDCRKVIEREPDNIPAYKRIGRLLFQEGRYEEAVDFLEKAVEKAPDDPVIWGELGRISYRGSKDYSKSIVCCAKALALDDKPVWIHCNLCLALLHEGRFDEAKKGFLNIIRNIQDAQDCEDEYQENIRALLHDCLGELYNAKKEASGSLLKGITDIIELLELEKIYFH